MATDSPLNTCQGPLLLYEVIRVTDGIPLFSEDHIDRLVRSAQLSGIKSHWDTGQLITMINNFIRGSKLDSGNIKLNCSFTGSREVPVVELQIIPHYYPCKEEYQNGVKTGLLHADRINPLVKAEQSSLREQANQSIKTNHLFEVLLVDSEGTITEGSRSNIFFIRENQLYSPPVHKILNGITRIKVLQLCKGSGIGVTETNIPTENLVRYDAAFLTGTSPKVLPICSVESHMYRTDHPLLLKIMLLYNQLIEDYLDIKKHESKGQELLP